MARTTTTFKTPVDAHEVEVYEYLTGGEAEQIQDEVIGGIKVDIAGETSGELSGKNVRKAQDITLKLMLVSVDGSKDDLIKVVKDFRQKDYQAVIDKINKLTSEEASPEKKS